MNPEELPPESTRTTFSSETREKVPEVVEELIRGWDEVLAKVDVALTQGEEFDPRLVALAKTVKSVLAVAKNWVQAESGWSLPVYISQVSNVPVEGSLREKGEPVKIIIHGDQIFLSQAKATNETEPNELVTLIQFLYTKNQAAEGLMKAGLGIKVWPLERPGSLTGDLPKGITYSLYVAD